MSDDHIDEETLAAFLDGRLDASDRARVVRVLASSPGLFDEFREAAAVAGALRATEHAPVPGVPRWRRNALMVVPLLAAAGIVGILITRPGRAPDAIALAQASARTLAAGPASLERNLGPAWSSPPWSVTRGGPIDAGAGAAVRLGARYAQLELAATAADTSAWHGVANALAGQLGAVEAAGPLSSLLRAEEIPDGPDRASLAMQLRELSGSAVAFDLGVWMESARLSALGGHSTFFDADGPGIRLLRVLRATPPAALAATLEALAAFASEAEGPIDPTLALARLDSAFARVPR